MGRMGFSKKKMATLLALLGVFTLTGNQNRVNAKPGDVGKDDKYFNANGLNAYKTGMSPGMSIRLNEYDLDKLKSAFVDFFPHYLEFDYTKPKEWKYTFRAFY